MYPLILTILSLPAVWAASDGYSWAYSGQNGESTWATKYNFCGGVYQSPLDFHHSILQYDSTLVPIKLNGYNASITDLFTLSNNGHTVSLSMLPSMYIEIPTFKYFASHIHFHWGDLASPKGSEHCVEGKRFAAEMHIVHYNSKYKDVSVAMNAADGLAVLGILIEVGSFNSFYDSMISQLAKVRYKGQESQIPGFNLQDLLPERLDEYYRYEGSLTTPPCNPSVLWTVFRNPVSISEEQLRSLVTALHCDDGKGSDPVEMTNNFRQLQQEGERLVSVSFREGVVIAVALASLLAALVIIGVACYIFNRKRRSKKNQQKKVVYTPAMVTDENISKV